MPAPTWALDLQSVRALAHKLYCSCKLTHLPTAKVASDTHSIRPGTIEHIQTAGEKCQDATKQT
jgi:hypothetical protein